MRSERRKRAAPLTLVAVPETDAARRMDGGLDWSALMARAQHGDRKAYRVLLENVTPYIRSIAARCFNQPSNIEDAVQDVLLTLHAVRHTYDPKRPFGPWLVAIANRRIIDRLRLETRQRTREIMLTAEHETFSDSPANLDEARFGVRALGDAIERLPPDQRQAVKMLKLSEMSLKEAAAASGRSIAALKVATHRAVKNLRGMLMRRGERP